MIVILGLGNPEKKYSETRHNIGWLALDFIKTSWHFPRWQNKKVFHSLVSQDKMHNKKVLLVKPLTYMNKSGDAILAIKNYLNVPPENIWILHDELDVPFGEMKISHDRSAAGHKGVESIMKKLGSNESIRWRLGIAGKNFRMNITGEKYVLSRFKKSEKAVLKKIFKRVDDSLNLALLKNPSSAMTLYNKKRTT